MSDETHEGWTNYATWGVALVLNNDEGTYNEIRGYMLTRARAGARAYLADPDNRGSVLTVEDCTRQNLSYELKDYTEELCGLEEDPGPSLMARQVISAGLAEVNWDEIARSVLDES